MNHDLEALTHSFLAHRPKFFALIRPYEAWLYRQHQDLIRGEVLDFGCGDGFFAETALAGIKQSTDFNLIGVDVIESRIKQAQDKKVYDEIRNYDGSTLPFANNSFDTVISNSVLEHIADLDQSILEISRVLKPGGYCLITVMTDKWNQFLLGKKILGKLYTNWLKNKQVHYNLLPPIVWRKKFENHSLITKKTVGYLPKLQTRVNECMHYISIFSLLSYKLTGRWVLWTNSFRLCPLTKLINKLNQETRVDECSQAGSIFLLLKKIQ